MVLVSDTPVKLIRDCSSAEVGNRGTESGKVPLKQLDPAVSIKAPHGAGNAPRLGQILAQCTLHQLKSFEATARHSSFTLAARELYLTQPTISMQVKQLADVVGVPLFEQVGKKVFLTEVGQELLRTCRGVFEQLTQFETQVAELKGMKQGSLRIAATSPINWLTNRLVNPFCHRYPGIQVSLEVLNSEQIMQQLFENTADLYLMSEPPDHPRIHSQAFVENPLVVVASAGHPLAAEQHLSIDRLRNESFVMREVGSATRQAVQTVLNQYDVPVRVRFEVGNNEAIKLMVTSGLGISVLSRHSVAAEVASGTLAILDVEGFPIDRSWYAVYPLSKQLPIIASTFLQFIRDEIENTAMQAA